MRKLILLFSIILTLCGCSDKSDPIATYTFLGEGMINKIIEMGEDLGYSDTYVDVLISEFYGEQCVYNRFISKADDIYKFEASAKAEYLKVRIDIYMQGCHNKEDVSESWYTANVFYLTPNENTDIIFNANTIVQKTEPK
jgi:uncharacterized lipoprotein NlpE involved in copper resistance